MKATNIFISILVICIIIMPFVSLAGRVLPTDTIKQTGLRVGDEVPDFVIEHIDNYKTSSVKLSEFKGKLIILDFWAIWCAPCIAALPKMDSLQTKFKDQLQVVLVNPSSHRKLDSLLTRGRKTGLIDRKIHTRSFVFEKLVSVTSDRKFGELFPHMALPHYVWIGEDLKVVAITSGMEVTKGNIEKHLSKQGMVVQQKNDLMDFDYNASYLPQILKVDSSSLKMYSSIIGYIPELVGGSVWYNPDSTNQIVRVKHSNLSLLAMFGMAYSNFSQRSPFNSAFWDYGKRVQLITSDPGKYQFSKSGMKSDKEWALKYIFNYEAVFPLVGFETLASYLISDLEKFFQIESKIERQTRKFYAIVRTSKEDKISFTGDASKLTSVVSYDDDETMNIDGGTMETLRAKISKENLKDEHLFIDKSNFEGRLQMSLKSPLGNLPMLRSELKQKYDLDLVEMQLPVEVLVLKDK